MLFFCFCKQNLNRLNGNLYLEVSLSEIVLEDNERISDITFLSTYCSYIVTKKRKNFIILYYFF